MVTAVITESKISNFLSYKSAAINTTKHEPALCTNAPVVDVKIPIKTRVTIPITNETAANFFHGVTTISSFAAVPAFNCYL